MDQPVPDAPPTRMFLVERYWPDVDEATVRSVVASLERAASAMTAEGTNVKHIVSILMPGDQVIFSLIQAADETVARQLNARAAVPLDRIAAAVALGLQD